MANQKLENASDVADVVKDYFRKSNPLGEHVFINEIKKLNSQWRVRVTVPEVTEGKPLKYKRKLVTVKDTGEVEGVKDDKE